jgi:N-acetylmuramoyl-L-alanine amidase
MKKSIVLDAGHGATYARVGGKMFNHQGHVFHKGSIFYEGTFNRQIADKLKCALELEGHKVGFSHHAETDLSFTQRRNIAMSFKPDLFISLHANASPNNNARGFEIFAGTGNKAGIQFGNDIFKEVKKEFGNEIRYRPLNNQQLCKEHSLAMAWFMRNDVKKSVLIEFDFFDHLEGAKFLNDSLIQTRFCNAITKAVNKQ